MAEDSEKNNADTGRISTRLVPYVVRGHGSFQVRDVPIERAEELDPDRTKPRENPSIIAGIFNNKSLKRSEVVMSHEEGELLDLQIRVRELFGRVGFKEDLYASVVPIKKAFSVPSGTLWFELIPPHPSKDWLPDSYTLQTAPKEEPINSL